MKIKWKTLLVSIALPLGIGLLSSLITSNSMRMYEDINKPAISPPGYLFPIVWTILFILMGIASYIVYMSDSVVRQRALRLYGAQLLLIFVWPIIFFNFQAFTLALIVLVVLWGIVFTMIPKFTQISRLAGWLLLPYFIWLTYAAYLNYEVMKLN